MDQGEQVGAPNGEPISNDDAGWREARTVYVRPEEEARFLVERHDGYQVIVVQVRAKGGGRAMSQEAQEAPEAQEGVQVRTANR